MFGPVRDDHDGPIHTGVLKLLNSAICLDETAVLFFQREIHHSTPAVSFPIFITFKSVSPQIKWLGVNRAFMS